MSLRCRVTLSQALPSNVSRSHLLTYLRKEIGPINLTFEIPMYNVSNLQVSFLGDDFLHNSWSENWSKRVCLPFVSMRLYTTMYGLYHPILLYFLCRQVRYLRISDQPGSGPLASRHNLIGVGVVGRGSSSPFRWVRYVTQSSSYVCRL